MAPASNCVRGQGEGAVLSGQNMQRCRGITWPHHYMHMTSQIETMQGYRNKMTHHDTWTWLFMHLTHGRSDCTGTVGNVGSTSPLPVTLHQSTVCLLCGLFEWFSSTVIAMEYRYFWFDYTLCNKNCMFMGGQTFKPKSVLTAQNILPFDIIGSHWYDRPDEWCAR